MFKWLCAQPTEPNKVWVQGWVWRKESFVSKPQTKRNFNIGYQYLNCLLDIVGLMLLPFSGPHHWAGSTWSRPAAAGHSGRTAESAVPGPDPELDPADLQRRDDSTGRQRRAELRHFPGFGELLGAADADRDHLFSLHVSVTSSPERLKERERLNHQQRQNNKNFFQKKETKLFKKAKKIFFVFFSS